MRIAAQLYTIRDRLRDPDRVGESLGLLREIGYSAIEVAGAEPRVGERLAEEMARAGLVACAAHVSLGELTADLEAAASRCRLLGCEHVVVPSLPDDFHSASGFRRFATMAVQLAGRLRAHGLSLAYHNHAFELEMIDGRSGLQILFEETPPDGLNAELDTYWLHVGGANPVTWIRRLAGRLPLVHLKDASAGGDPPPVTEVGEGTLDWPEILRACRDAGTEWLVVEQDYSTRDVFDSLAISYRNLTRMLAELR